MDGLVPAIHVLLVLLTVKAVLSPHRTDFLSRRDFAALNLGFRLGKVGFFLRRQLKWRLLQHAKTIAQQKGPGKTGAFENRGKQIRSARIEFDDQMWLHLYRERHVRQGRDASKLRGHLGVVGLDIVRHVAFGELGRFQHMRQLL